MSWRGPEYDGELTTLGWQVLDWMTAYLVAPDRAEYEPYVPKAEQADFVLRYYELNPITGRRMIRHGVIGRPRGWGKSPFVSATAVGANDVPGTQPRSRPPTGQISIPFR